MPKLYVVTGPSGTGLSDTLAALFRLRPDLSAVLPVTSRRMKEGETDGVGFRFYDLEAWSALKDAGCWTPAKTSCSVWSRTAPPR